MPDQPDHPPRVLCTHCHQAIRSRGPAAGWEHVETGEPFCYALVANADRRLLLATPPR